MCEHCEGCEYLKWWIDPGYDGEPTNTPVHVHVLA